MGPDGRVIHTVERETNGKYTFTANADGVYKYCFSNKMSSMTPKVVMFSMEIGDAPKEHDKGDGKYWVIKLRKILMFIKTDFLEGNPVVMIGCFLYCRTW